METTVTLHVLVESKYKEIERLVWHGRLVQTIKNDRASCRDCSRMYVLRDLRCLRILSLPLCSNTHREYM